jgi:tetratricopeptide (TPR) repeat protein
LRHQSSLAGKRPGVPGRRGIAAILALVTLGAAACGGSAPIPQAPVATTLAAGSAALRQHDYSAAEQLFMQVIKREPHQVAGYYDLGLAYQDQGEDSAALRIYAQAQAVDQYFVPVLYNRAVLYTASNPQLAIFLYRRAISIQRDSPTAYLNLGLLEAGQGPQLRHQAQVFLAQAVRLEPALASHIPAALRAGLASARPVASPSRSN